MAVFSVTLVKITFRVYAYVHWTGHFLEGTRYTQACITGHTVSKPIVYHKPDL